MREGYSIRYTVEQIMTFAGGREGRIQKQASGIVVGEIGDDDDRRQICRGWVRWRCKETNHKAG